MSVDRLQVPVLNDDLADFRAMFDLRRRVEASTGSIVVLDFSRCAFIRHAGVAFIGALIRHAQASGQDLRVDWSTLRSEVLTNLKQNGFAHAFGYGSGPWPGNSVPYREDRHADHGSIFGYLSAQWLGRGWINVSAKLSDAIQGRVWEIYTNAFEHANSRVGIVSCGQHYPRTKQLSLCVVDFGQGIASNVRRHLNEPQMSATKALEWAFVSGNSTAGDLKMGRGMGLNILSNFVKVNHGRLCIYSDAAFVQMSHATDMFGRIPDRFPGTVVDIRFTCDESRYALASEVPKEPLF